MITLKVDLSSTLKQSEEFVLQKRSLLTYNEFLLIDNYLFKEKGVVYFIYVNQSLKYIGKSKGKGFKQRMRNHFVTKNKKTSSKLENIKKEIKKGNKVKLSFLLTEKESLRSVIEEELILQFKSKFNLWNLQKG